jgi:HEAT repeat protein
MGLLEDDNAAVRYFAVSALRNLGAAEAAGPIKALSLAISERLQARTIAELFDDPLGTLADLSLQEVALRALAELDAREGLPAFLRAAAGRDLPRDSSLALRIADAVYQTRRLALYGLGYTGSAKAARLLAGASGLGDPDFRLRATAVRSLGVLGFPESAARVGGLLEDQAAEVRWTAASVLGRLGDTRAVALLIARLSDPVAEVRKQAALRSLRCARPPPMPQSFWPTPIRAGHLRIRRSIIHQDATSRIIADPARAEDRYQACRAHQTMGP